jgi:hypothetical protein
MKFTQFNFLNNDILDYPKSKEDSDSGEDTTLGEYKAEVMTQDVVNSSSESNKRTPSPPTQKEAKPMYHTPTTPIDDAMSQLNFNITQPANLTQAPPLILCSAMATMTSQTATVGPSQRGGGGEGGGGEGGFGGDGGDGRGGGGEGGGGGGRGGQPVAAAAAAAAVAPNPPRNGLKGVPPTIF